MHFPRRGRRDVSQRGGRVDWKRVWRGVRGDLSVRSAGGASTRRIMR